MVLLYCDHKVYCTVLRLSVTDLVTFLDTLKKKIGSSNPPNFKKLLPAVLVFHCGYRK